MATAITLTTEKAYHSVPMPECESAGQCHFFEKPGPNSSCCINNGSLSCPKRQQDIFAPYANNRRNRK